MVIIGSFPNGLSAMTPLATAPVLLRFWGHTKIRGDVGRGERARACGSDEGLRKKNSDSVSIRKNMA